MCVCIYMCESRDIIGDVTPQKVLQWHLQNVYICYKQVCMNIHAHCKQVYVNSHVCMYGVHIYLYVCVHIMCESRDIIEDTTMQLALCDNYIYTLQASIYECAFVFV